MYPDLLRLGGLTIHSYGMLIALALIMSALLLYREAPREKIKSDFLLEALLITVFFSLIGARLFYILLNWNLYGKLPGAILAAPFEGLSLSGALLAGLPALWFWCRRRNVNFLKLLDLFAPYIAFTYACGRIGCFLSGCWFGKASTVAWALPAAAGDPVLRHPVQLYAALGALLIFALLKFIRPHRPFVGFLGIALVALYGVLRFITEFFRHEPILWLGLTTAQLVSLGLILAMIILLVLYFFILPGCKVPELKLPRLVKRSKLRRGPRIK